MLTLEIKIDITTRHYYIISCMNTCTLAGYFSYLFDLLRLISFAKPYKLA